MLVIRRDSRCRNLEMNYEMRVVMLCLFLNLILQWIVTMVVSNKKSQADPVSLNHHSLRFLGLSTGWATKVTRHNLGCDWNFLMKFGYVIHFGHKFFPQKKRPSFRSRVIREPDTRAGDSRAGDGNRRQ